MRPLQLVALLLLTATLLAGCGSRQDDNPSAKVVVTIEPLRQIVAELSAGTSIEVIRLLPPNASPHTWEPTPSEARHAADAAVLLSISPELDGWAAKLESPKHMVLQDLIPRERLLFGECSGHGDHQHHEHSADEINPHFWLDPVLMKDMLPALADALAAALPDHAKVVRENAAHYAEELAQLDREVARILHPVRGQATVTFHASFDYMLARYGVELAAVFEPFPGKEAPAKLLAELQTLVEARGIRAVFTEPQLSPRPAEILAEECGVRLGLLDPLGGVEGRETYGALLLFNARALADGLQ